MDRLLFTAVVDTLDVARLPPLLRFYRVGAAEQVEAQLASIKTALRSNATKPGDSAMRKYLTLRVPELLEAGRWWPYFGLDGNDADDFKILFDTKSFKKLVISLAIKAVLTTPLTSSPALRRGAPMLTLAVTGELEGLLDNGVVRQRLSQEDARCRLKVYLVVQVLRRLVVEMSVQVLPKSGLLPRLKDGKVPALHPSAPPAPIAQALPPPPPSSSSKSKKRRVDVATAPDLITLSDVLAGQQGQSPVQAAVYVDFCLREVQTKKGKEVTGIATVSLVSASRSALHLS